MFALCAATRALAQQPIVSVQGVVYDSLRGVPLNAAVVVVLGEARTSVTNERGRFRFDSLSPGRHTFVVQHAYLDSVGLAGISKEETVRNGRDEVRLAVPSLATLWRGACGGEAPRDTGFVYGTVRDPVNRAPVPNATVSVAWVETQFDLLQGLRRKKISGETRTNARGMYAVCGVPVDQWVTVEAAADRATGRIHFPPANLVVQRRDLLLGMANTDSADLGSIRGMLVDADGFGYSEARVVLDDSIESRSGGDGRFVFRNVRPGTHQLEVFALGIMPVLTAVDVFRSDSASVHLQLRRVTTLDVVRVSAPSKRVLQIAQGIEDRRRTGSGYMMDLTELAAYPSFFNALNDLPAGRLHFANGDYTMYLPDGRGGECIPDVWIDGHQMTMRSLATIMPKDLAAVELFPRATSIPLEYRRAAVKTRCGALLVWTNFAFRRR